MKNAVNCKHYDKANGWCEKLSFFGYPKRIEYCPKSPCEHAEPIEQPMTDNDIIKALEHCIKCNQRQIANCNGCLFERIYPECDTEIEVMCLDLINRQKSEIERLQKYNTKKMRWIPADVKLPEEDECEYLVIVNGEYTNDEYANGPYATQRFERAVEIALYSEEEGWVLEAYPDWDDPVITHWMPLPEPPEADHDPN